MTAASTALTISTDMLMLKNIADKDIPQLKKYYFKNKSNFEIAEIIKEFQNKEYKGKYFEMFGIYSSDLLIGLVSLYQHNSFAVSAGPEIFEPYRKMGYGYEAMVKAYEIAKAKGFKLASAQIKKDNIASIKLHEKLGFELEAELINKKGNEVYVYQKLL